MSVFVSEFAAQRGMTVQGVYKAIKRHGIPTQQGVSNGKAAQFMSDEDAARLNELLGPTATHALVLQQNLENSMLEAREQIHKEKEAFFEKYTQKADELQHAKDEEVNTTRQLMLDHIDTGVAEMRQMILEEHNGTIKMYQGQVKELEKQKKALEETNKALSDENQRLKNQLQQTTEELEYIKAHPYKNVKAAWDRKKEAKQNGQSQKDN